MVFSSYVSAKNQMVSLDQGVKAAWSEVDVQMERRADLIPNLVETVKGFTKEESTVFGDIANARAGLLNAQGWPPRSLPMAHWIPPLGACCCSQKTIPSCVRATVYAPAGRACRNRESHQRGPETVQRRPPELQHVCAAISQQYLGRYCGLQAEHGLLHGQSRGSASAQREVLGRL